MRRIRLIHWNAGEAAERAVRLRAAGYRVEFDPLTPDVLRRIKEEPPAAVVIDLGRIPSQGRDIALALRTSKASRRVPLVFSGGEPEKVDRIRGILPDAVYTDWRRIGGALKRAIAHPPADPVVPESNLAGYSGTPLPKKLGIRAGSVVALIGAPPDFEKTLGVLPEGTVLRRGARGPADLGLWFVSSRGELERGIDRMRDLPVAGLWIAWRKKASVAGTDLAQDLVRRTGLDAGLVDYKICAIDATWSGLKFTRARKP